MVVSSNLRHVVYMLAVSSLVLGIAEAASLVVRQVGELKQFNGIPGLTHITLAGAVDHGQKEVEAWVETIIPGRGTPIHRHELEEIFIVLKGSGTVYIAPGPESDKNFPGEPEAIPFSSNSTFSIPWNAVHQVINTNDEDLHVYVIISRPPMISYMYKDWNTPHDAAVSIDLPWEKPEESTPTKDEL
ncbi:hypothetical protein KC19_10G106300 [Ceratodon purpureus]|uniref:Uncharacterized protein n=1 Tax=Ceratodon purpureus TaxID=3225 RepID=A0A8T0GIW0_CERPU|nr:hypothetical protein KC19_10G106300 [Ceratodon purpureus]